MAHDTKRLAVDLSSVISTLCPEVDLARLTVRLEEVLTNYEIHRKTVAEVENDMPEKVAIYLSAKKLEGLSDITLRDYLGELRRFTEFCPKATAQVATTDIREYLASHDDVMMSTIGTKLSVLKSFFGWLVQEGVILRDPTAKVKTPKTPKRLPKGLSIEELELVRESCVTLRERALLEVFYSTGCRLSEISAMKRSDIDMQALVMRVIGKGNKERTVYLSFKAIYHLRSYLASRTDDDDALFVSVRTPYRQLGNAAIQKIFRKLANQAKLSKTLSPHVMRHTYANLKMDAGVDLADLQQLLGHSSPSTTLTYAQVSEERKRQAFKKYHVQ